MTTFNTPVRIKTMIKNGLKTKNFYKDVKEFVPGQIRSTKISIADNKYPPDMWEPISFLLLEEQNGYKDVWGGMFVLPISLPNMMHGVNLYDVDFKINTPHVSCLRSIPLYYGWFYMDESMLGNVLGELDSAKRIIRKGLEYAVTSGSFKEEELPFYKLLYDIKTFQYENY